MVTYAGVPSLPWSWDHFHTAEDGEYNSVAARIKAEFWDFYRCDEGFQARVAQVQHKVCRSRLADLYYETRLQCIVNYNADVLGVRVKKADARTMTLTREQYLSAPPLLGGNCGQVALGRVDGEAQDPPGLPPADGWVGAPPRQPEPRRIRPDLVPGAPRPGLQRVHDVHYGTQGQGDCSGRHLQPDGQAQGVQQREHLQQAQRVHLGGSRVAWGGLRSGHPASRHRPPDEAGRREVAQQVLDGG